MTNYYLQLLLSQERSRSSRLLSKLFFWQAAFGAYFLISVVLFFYAFLVGVVL